MPERERENREQRERTERETHTHKQTDRKTETYRETETREASRDLTLTESDIIGTIWILNCSLTQCLFDLM